MNPLPLLRPDGRRPAPKKPGRLFGWIYDNRICFYSFLLPFLAMMMIFIRNGIFPFGDESFMHSDMYHQYVPFLQEFLRKLREGEGLTYSRNIGMGSNYLALFLYYSASPFNWLILLCPSQYLIEFMSYMVVFKIGLCGFTFAWYLKERFSTGSLLILFFSVFYAMSGFVAAYNWDVMWMDCLVLAPLIVLGLERLVREERTGLYCVTLTLSILSNYYLSIMICIFLCLYFLVLLPELWRSDAPKASLGRIGMAAARFVLFSILAGGMAAAVLLPEIAALSFTEFTESSFPKTVTWYFPFLDVIARHATGVSRETGLDHWPNIFCSSAVFFLIPLYAFHRGIPFRQKLARLLLCAFLIVSFSVNTLTFLWHGFNYPDSLPCRQSFLYILLVLTMCFEAALKPEGYSCRELFRAVGFALLFLLFAKKLVDDDAFSTGIFLLSAVLVLAYGLLLYGWKRLTPAPCDAAGTPAEETGLPEPGSEAPKAAEHNGARRLLALLALGLAAFEATFNMAYTSVSTTGRSGYLEKIPAYRALAERRQAADPDYYRFEKFSRVTKNDGALADYPTASLFSSTANANVEDWYDRMGLSESKVFYCFDGQTPFSSALLNVRYMFSRTADEDPTLYELLDQQDGVYLYRCRYTLPAGYMLRDSWNLSSAKLEEGSENPFDLQNRMAASTGVPGSLFSVIIPEEEEEGTALFYADRAGHYYAYCARSQVDNVRLSSASVTKSFSKVKYDYILDLGYHEADELITLENQDAGALEACAARLNTDVLSETLDWIGAQPFLVDDWDYAHISGHVDAAQPGRLVLSVAYEPGWTLKVDGQEAEIELADEMFIAARLEAGSHTVELSFFPAGLKSGILISLASLAAFLILQRLLREEPSAPRRRRSSGRKRSHTKI